MTFGLLFSWSDSPRLISEPRGIRFDAKLVYFADTVLLMVGSRINAEAGKLTEVPTDCSEY